MALTMDKIGFLWNPSDASARSMDAMKASRINARGIATKRAINIGIM